MTRLDPLMEQLAQTDKAYMMLSIARTIDEQATLKLNDPRDPRPPRANV